MNKFKKEKTRKLLSGKAVVAIDKNSMFWSCTLADYKYDDIEFFHIKWYGFNSDSWWDNTSKRISIMNCTGDKGTEKRFKLDYITCDVVEIVPKKGFKR